MIRDIINQYESYKNTANKLQKNFANLGGSEKAANIVELEALKYVKKRNSSGNFK
ncbi:hypothetical protein ES703_80286 [subsurface metagenome]